MTELGSFHDAVQRTCVNGKYIGDVKVALSNFDPLSEQNEIPEQESSINLPPRVITSETQ